MLSRHSSSFLFTLSKTLSFFSRRPLHRHLPSRHAPTNPRLLHSAPLFLSLKSSAEKRPPKRFHHYRQHRRMNNGASSPSEAPKSEEAEGNRLSRKAMNRARRESPEGVLRHHLDMCSKRGDLLEALRLYDDARARRVPLSQHHYNVLLYLCSSPHPSSPLPMS